MNPPLDIENHDALTRYLIGTKRLDRDEISGIKTLGGGVSSRTVAVQRHRGPAWVIKQALPKLRVAMDWFSDPLRVHREAEGLRALQQLTCATSVPRFVFEDYEHHLFAMEAVPTPHVVWKSALLDGRIDPDAIRQFAELLATIHREAWAARDALSHTFSDRSYFESLRIEPYYECTATLVPDAADFLRSLVTSTRERRLTLVHGDYSPKNILVCNKRLVLLDHEVIHWGDAAFDVGFATTHFLSKAHHLPGRRVAFLESAHAFWQTYFETLGPVPWREGLELHAVRHTLACLLARVSGRSPLEYLDSTERERQRAAVLALLRAPPTSMPQLANAFVEEIASATSVKHSVVTSKPPGK